MGYSFHDYSIATMQRRFRYYNESKQTRTVKNRDEIILTDRNNGYNPGDMLTVRPAGHYEGKQFIADGTLPYRFYLNGADEKYPAMLVDPSTGIYTLMQQWMEENHLHRISRLLPGDMRMTWVQNKYAANQFVLAGGTPRDYPTRRWTRDCPKFVMREDGTILSGGFPVVHDDVAPEKKAMLVQYRKKMREWFTPFEMLRGSDDQHEVYGRTAVRKWVCDRLQFDGSYWLDPAKVLPALLEQLQSDTPDEQAAYMYYLCMKHETQRHRYNDYSGQVMFHTLDRLLKEQLYRSNVSI